MRKKDASDALFHCEGFFGYLMLESIWRLGRHNRSYVALRGCVEAVLLMSADVRRHVLAIVLV